MRYLTIEKADKGLNFCFDDTNPYNSDGIYQFEPTETDFMIAKGKKTKFFIFLNGRCDWQIDFFKYYFMDYCKKKESITYEDIQNDIIPTLMHVSKEVYSLSNNNRCFVTTVIVDKENVFEITDSFYLRKINLPYYATVFDQTVTEVFDDLPFEEKMSTVMNQKYVRRVQQPYLTGNTTSSSLNLYEYGKKPRKIKMGEFIWQ